MKRFHLPKPDSQTLLPREEGISLGQSLDRNGRITFLSKHSDYFLSADILLKDFELNGFQKTVRIQLKVTHVNSLSILLSRMLGTKKIVYSRRPFIDSMTIDNEGMVWVGGLTDHHMGIASDPHSRAYLARLDSSAVPIWERSYKTGNVPFVASMTPTATGNMLIAATDGWLGPSWLAKVDAEGRLIWKATIPASFAVNSDQHEAALCHNPAVATLPDGDALVACAAKGRIQTHRFNRLTGEDKQGSLLLPACNKGERWVDLSLFVRPDGQVLISGTRPSGHAGPGCSWLARFSVEGT